MYCVDRTWGPNRKCSISTKTITQTGIRVGSSTRCVDECGVLMWGFLEPCVPGRVIIKFHGDLYSMDRTEEFSFQTSVKVARIDLAVSQCYFERFTSLNSDFGMSTSMVHLAVIFVFLNVMIHGTLLMSRSMVHFVETYI